MFTLEELISISSQFKYLADDSREHLRDTEGQGLPHMTDQGVMLRINNLETVSRKARELALEMARN